MIISSDTDILQNTSRELVIVQYLESIRPQIVPLWEFRQHLGLGYGRLSRTLLLDYKEVNHVLFSKYFTTGLYSRPDDLLKVMKDLLVRFVVQNKKVKNVNLSNFKLVIFP